MHDSKLLQYLNQLSPLELNRFEKFVHSPFFHQHEDTIRLFEELKKHHPEFEGPALSKEAVFKSLFPQKKYKASTIYGLAKNLLQLLVQFLKIESLEKQQPEFLNLLLMQELEQRKLTKYIPKLWEEGMQIITKSPFRNSEYYLRMGQYQEFQVGYSLKGSNRSHKVSYLPAMENLDHYYVLQKLRYAAAIANRQLEVALKSEIPLLDEIIAYCERTNLNDHPTINMYYQALRLSLEKEAEEGEIAAERLEQLLKLSGYMLPEDERYNLYTLMINFANRNYRQGKMEYLRKMFDLYRQLIKEDLLFHGYDAMTDNLNFKNVVTIGLRLEEMDWTEDFIKKYRSKLDPASRDAIYYFSLANLHFFKAEYSKALKYLKRVEFIDSFLRLNYDMLLMKTYYECEETEALLSLCNSFNMFIRRNKALSETNKEAYLNMGRYVRKLIRYREKKLYQRQGMMQDLAALKPLVEINWLQSKAEELAPEED